MKKWFAIFTLAGVAYAGGAQAQEEYPWYSVKRLTLAARFERVYWDSEFARPKDKEFAAGVAGLWALVPNLSLTARYIHGLDTNEDHLAIGISLKFFDGLRDLR